MSSGRTPDQRPAWSTLINLSSESSLSMVGSCLSAYRNSPFVTEETVQQLNKAIVTEVLLSALPYLDVTYPPDGTGW